MKYHSRDSWCSAPDSRYLEYVSRALPLRQPAQFSIRAIQQSNYIFEITVIGEKRNRQFFVSCSDAWENETAE
jgi:hypothetical protein